MFDVRLVKTDWSVCQEVVGFEIHAFFLIKNNILMKCMKINVVMCDKHYLAWFEGFSSIS